MYGHTVWFTTHAFHTVLVHLFFSSSQKQVEYQSSFLFYLFSITTKALLYKARLWVFVCDGIKHKIHNLHIQFLVSSAP